MPAIDLLAAEGGDTVDDARVDRISVAPLLASVFSNARITVLIPC
jgi:hypothetical protein